MDLEDKIKALQEEFKDLPKVLIKRTLCGDDVNEDLAKATDRLREFKQMKNDLVNNGDPANTVTEELKGSLYPHPAFGRDIKSNSWIEEDDTVYPVTPLTSAHSPPCGLYSNQNLRSSYGDLGPSTREDAFMRGLQAVLNSRPSSWHIDNTGRYSPSPYSHPTEIATEETANSTSDMHCNDLSLASRRQKLTESMMDSTKKARGTMPLDPPKTKPKPNRRKQREHDGGCEVSRGVPPPPPPSHALRPSYTPPPPPHAQPTTPPPPPHVCVPRPSYTPPPLPHALTASTRPSPHSKLSRPSYTPPPPPYATPAAPPPPPNASKSRPSNVPPPPPFPQSTPPPPPPQANVSRPSCAPPPPPYATPAAPPPPPNASKSRPSYVPPPPPFPQSTPPPPPPQANVSRPLCAPPPPPYATPAAPPPPSNATKSRPSYVPPPPPFPQSTPPPPPPQANVSRPSCAPPPPPQSPSTSFILQSRLKLPSPSPFVRNCLERTNVINDTLRKDNDTALNPSKDTNNNNVEEEQKELEDKVKKLKKEFTSLSKILIKRTLCAEDVDGDMTKARQRLQEFNRQLNDSSPIKNPMGMGAELGVGELSRDLNNSPVFRSGNKARNHFEEQQRGNLLPRNWTPMPRDGKGNDVTVHLERLDSTSAEYQEVEQRFQQTVTSGLMIDSIERIQNPFLYQAYQLRKKKMDRDNKGDNERRLFHGTNSVNVTKINTQGFDRSFSGYANGAVYGSGVYFARDASYSVHYTGGSCRVMYLARVLVGKYCQGSKSMKKPPPINPEQPEILFDSLVNNMQDPSIFVVYYDNQSYPEYLITLQ